MKLTIGSVGQPKTSRQNKTGSWRTTKRPEFLQKKCSDCKICMLVCPEGVVFGNGRNTYYVDLDYCKGCGICAQECPAHDIVMVTEVR
jgi:pyruvate ferredoxin oxidoreductase delta subunit